MRDIVDYYGEDGCCKTCDKQEENLVDEDEFESKGWCICYDCNCKKCDWYEKNEFEEGGFCTY